MSGIGQEPGRDGPGSKSLALIEKLPLLVIELFCEYLAQPDSLRDDLVAFSLASTACAAGAARFRLRRLHLRISGPMKLLEDLQYVRKEQLRHLRQIKLTGTMLRDSNGSGRTVSRRSSGWSLADQGRDSNYSLKLRGDFCKLPESPTDLAGFDPFGQVLDDEHKQRLDDAWRPLSDFILKLYSLTNIVYACSEQFPRYLLETLHNHLPNTRLHVHTFSLRSLYHADYIQNLDPDEYKLATSPNLYGVASIYYSYNRSKVPGYNKYALQSMVNGLAPNLKSLAAWSCPPTLHRPARGLPNPTSTPWAGFLGQGAEEEEQQKQQQQSLCKGFLANLVCDAFETAGWLNHSNPSELVSLAICTEAIEQEFEHLSEISRSIGFGKLDSLQFRVAVRPGHPVRNAEDDGIATFLRSLRPLTMLDIGGALDENTLNAIVDCHGASLQTLRLDPDFIGHPDDPPEKLRLGPLEIKKLTRGCRELVHLEVSIPRTEGNKNEVAIYRALGQMPELRRLELNLDCYCNYMFDPWEPPWEVSNVGEDGIELPEDEFASILVNAAIDSELARDIFYTIENEGSNMEYLRIRPYNLGGLWPSRVDESVQDIVDWLGQSWVCTLLQEDKDLVIHNIDEHKRGPGWVLESNFNGCDKKRDVWLDIWPDPGKDKRETWSSIPLDL